MNVPNKIRIFLVGLLLTSYPCVASDPSFQFRDFPQGGGSNNAPTKDSVSPASENAAPPPAYTPAVTNDPKEMVSTPAPAEAPPPMRFDTEPRAPYGLGTFVNPYGGIVAFQDGTLKITSPAAPGAEVRGSSQSEVGGVAGIKMGYTWSSFDAIASSHDPAALLTPDLIEPSLAADFFWNKYRYKATGSGTTSSGGVTAGYDGDLRANVDTYTFCVEPTVRFNLGAFRPYIGFGVGGTYLDASHGQLDGNVTVLGTTGTGRTYLTGSSDDVDFTAEGLAGVECFLDAHWALTFDYKFLYFVSPDFHGNIPGSTINYHLSGLDESMFTGGFSYYF